MDEENKNLNPESCPHSENTEAEKDNGSASAEENEETIKEVDAEETDKTESDRIVQEELHGLIKLRRLHKLQKAVYYAAQYAVARAEHIGIQHDGNARRKRYGAGLGQFEKFDV